MRNAVFFAAILIVLAFAADAPRTAAQRSRRDPIAALLRTPRVAQRAWSSIVIHHSATPTGNAERFDAFHRGVRRWRRGMAYHFVIGNGHGLDDGAIEVGSRWTLQHPGAHVASSIRDPRSGQPLDNVAIGICLVGNYDEQRPTPRQMTALASLVDRLRRRYRILPSRVVGHREVPGAHTACPGRRLDLDALRSRLSP